MYDIFLDRLPRIDLHGFDRDSARVAINDFIDDSVILGYSEVVIVHGIGSGIIKNVVQEVLAKRKDIVDFYILGENVGCTKVIIK